ncbi:cytochrome bd-I oxidase subunit CydX [Fontimonas sp. SYSU GA230001]|uniref:cytochrome bd-I oxidase subunit CydX n=1 Tax=Fontimonas sp. SYSU GA230001 TaxID=3142450 RepID=UPI0032B45ED2
MWYFAWILGLGLAMTFGILNAIWFEIREIERERPAGQGPGDAVADLSPVYREHD